MLCWNCGKLIEEGTVCPECGIDNKKKETKVGKNTDENTNVKPGICKICGNPIPEGTYCFRCGTENDVQKNNSNIEEAKKEIARSSVNTDASKIVILGVVVLGILWTIVAIMEPMYSECAKNRPYECMFHLFCSSDCKPLFYEVLHFITIILTIFAFLVSPLLLILIFDQSKRNKMNRMNSK